MLRLNLQFFGGRGGSARGGRGGVFGGGGGGSVNELEPPLDVWSYRHNRDNEPFVDSINTAARTLENDFPGLMSDVGTVNAVKLSKADEGVLGYYRHGEAGVNNSVNMNVAYTDIDVMNSTYDAGTKRHDHPSRGKKSGVEAVALHELGHALNDHIAGKIGYTGDNKMEKAANKIVSDACNALRKKRLYSKMTNGQLREVISKYALTNNKETVAEAISDYYCNGNKATAVSKAIMAEINKYK